MIFFLKVNVIEKLWFCRWKNKVSLSCIKWSLKSYNPRSRSVGISVIVAYKFFGILIDIILLIFVFSVGLITFFFGEYSANIVPKLFNFLVFLLLELLYFNTFLLVYICTVNFHYLSLVYMKECLFMQKRIWKWWINTNILL